ncbi:hypothetical protein [Amycolatopsis sp. PS_44_ISF1]|uniref:hypothetical protein n=1 Tax=Amycolatopsis sp. PS_44_ISF1 TaxID=2974917 RepID=UPI0028DE2F7D|nr:hypothetical protein [Amycolatopsis sp. PS_44_ISF1]MDT8913587.1 hypothetical protein [Amycolatopsis sp. PS_44_ISF1]
MLFYAERAGFTVVQVRAASRDPRWVNRVRRQPAPVHQRKPRYRYRGRGVAVIAEGTTAIAVIVDGPRKMPPAESRRFTDSAGDPAPSFPVCSRGRS